ncbi:MAG: hypothetical protein HY928_02475 [Elusimicrobia bacterium]|nr:hypothetical protein [Elusimicrobiota bacterium]
MSLRSFHIVLITSALALSAFLGAWAGARGFTPLAVAAALGIAFGLPYLYWFMGRADASR